MAAKFCVQRINTNANPQRFEWLDKAPTFDVATAEVVDLRWTNDPAAAKDFVAAKASEWVDIIEGATLVRFGDAPPEEARDLAAEERARKKARREERARREAGDGSGAPARAANRPAKASP